MVYQTHMLNSSSSRIQRMKPNRRPGPSVPLSTPAGMSPSPCKWQSLFVCVCLNAIFIILSLNQWILSMTSLCYFPSCFAYMCSVSWKHQTRTVVCPSRCGTGTEPLGMTSWGPCRLECLSSSKLLQLDGPLCFWLSYTHSCISTIRNVDKEALFDGCSISQ